MDTGSDMEDGGSLWRTILLQRPKLKSASKPVLFLKAALTCSGVCFRAGLGLFRWSSRLASSNICSSASRGAQRGVRCSGELSVKTPGRYLYQFTWGVGLREGPLTVINLLEEQLKSNLRTSNDCDSE